MVATRIRRLRRQQFLTQEELALKAKIHSVSLTRIERGHVVPRARTLRRLAKALGVEPGDLMRP